MIASLTAIAIAPKTARRPTIIMHIIERHVHAAMGCVSIDGCDTVAYHPVGTPTKVTAEFKAEYPGVVWHFASAANRDHFAANPVKHAPAYGGWCSSGASKGKKVATKPQFWKVVDGQHYLNSSEAAHKTLFLADTPGIIRKGEANSRPRQTSSEPARRWVRSGAMRARSNSGKPKSRMIRS